MAVDPFGITGATGAVGGRVAARLEGAFSPRELEAAIQKALATSS